MHSSQNLLNQANKALAKPSQTQQTHPGANEMQSVAPLINEVFDQFQALYGRKFTSRFGDQQQVDKTKRTWAIAFVKENITFEQITFALQQILYMRLQWPPELLEFLRLCDDEAVTGIPSLQYATKHILACNTQFKHSKDKYAQKHLAHSLLAYLNEKCAIHVNKPESSYEQHVRREYNAALMKFKAGTLPQPKIALPAPDMPYVSKDYTPTNTDPAFTNRLKQLGQLFGANDGK